ncbi:MAG: hypothetical protein U9N04_02175 [Patescibacteria group bacterium]|nr:hypothetical protein [Patescibacteria group bacterium]
MKEVQSINENPAELFVGIDNLRKCHFKNEDQERAVFLNAIKENTEVGSLVEDSFLIAPQNNPEEGAYFLQYGQENDVTYSVEEIETLADFGSAKGLFEKYRKEVDEILERE